MHGPLYAGRAICNSCIFAILTVPPPTCRAQNPALRHELSFEMGQLHSEMALHFHNSDKPSKPVLPREGQECPLKANSF